MFVFVFAFGALTYPVMQDTSLLSLCIMASKLRKLC